MKTTSRWEKEAQLLIDLFYDVTYRRGIPDIQKAMVATDIRELVMEQDGYTCVECGCDDIERLTVDHIVPRGLGGRNNRNNLRTMCVSCNMNRGAALGRLLNLKRAERKKERQNASA